MRARARVGLWRLPVRAVSTYRSSPEFGLVAVVELERDGRLVELPAEHVLLTA